MRLVCQTPAVTSKMVTTFRGTSTEEFKKLQLIKYLPRIQRNKINKSVHYNGTATLFSEIDRL